MRYRFNDVEIDCAAMELRRTGVLVPTEPQVFDLLRLLIENRARVVSRDELIATVWQGRIVSDGAGKPWWQGENGAAYPVEAPPTAAAFGMELAQSAALWNGSRLSLLSAQTDWGRVAFDA